VQKRRKEGTRSKEGLGLQKKNWVRISLIGKGRHAEKIMASVGANQDWRNRISGKEAEGIAHKKAGGFEIAGA